MNLNLNRLLCYSPDLFSFFLLKIGCSLVHPNGSKKSPICPLIMNGQIDLVLHAMILEYQGCRKNCLKQIMVRLVEKKYVAKKLNVEQRGRWMELTVTILLRLKPRI